MVSSLTRFEEIARRAYRFSSARQAATQDEQHPFEERNIHPALPKVVRDLFDDGHYSQASFEAFKFVDKEVKRHSKLTESGFKLMMAAFSESSPAVQLTPLKSQTDKDEQKGYQFLFAGTVMAIRNPRGHEILTDDPDTCLDHLSIASHLLRRINDAGFR